ncbi:glycosyltransferase family 2 protein [Halarchaeum grantii]|nr:glycosyltransferase family 2 protein [Halarchaeum grantii]
MSAEYTDATASDVDTGEVDAGDALLLGAESEQDPTVSVIMPTMNEEEGIADCIEMVKRALADSGITAEIILSDDSTDRTPDIAREMGARVVNPDDEGYGYAYRYAFEHARGDYLVIGDADCTYDFEQFPALLQPVVAGEADMVMGSRLEGEIRDGAMPSLHQYVGNPLLTKFLNVFYGAGVSDAHSGFRVFHRDVLDTLDLSTDGMEFASEMIMDAGARDLTIEEIPITYHERKGEAKLESFRDGWRHVRFMLLNAPGYLFSIPGTLLGVLGVAVMALAATGLDIDGVSFGPHSMIAGSLLTLVGYQTASMGVFATIAADPIRRPNDAVTAAIVEHASLERAATVGTAIGVAGGAYALWLVYEWATSGFSTLPLVSADIVAFTAIVLGVQTVFGAFFMSAIASEN